MLQTNKGAGLLVKNIVPARKCVRCKKHKLNSDFATANNVTLLDGTVKNYLRRVCKVCYWNQKKERRLKIREWYNNYKSKLKCCECGYDRYPRALEFHHIEHNKNFTVSDMTNGHSIKSIMKEIKKCIVLCVRCHAEFHSSNENKKEAIAIDITKNKSSNNKKIKKGEPKMVWKNRSVVYFAKDGMGIKEFLSKNGIKQRWLAEQMKISESMLSLILTNKRNWQSGHVGSLANALGMNAEDINSLIVNA